MPWSSLLIVQAQITGHKGRAGDEGTFFLSLTPLYGMKAFKLAFPDMKRKKQLLTQAVILEAVNRNQEEMYRSRCFSCTIVGMQLNN